MKSVFRFLGSNAIDRVEPGSIPAVGRRRRFFIQKASHAVYDSPAILPIVMLFASNVFMTFAWYGHLKCKDVWLPLAIMVSWGIALFEYWLAAQPLGGAVYTAALETMQE